MADQRLKSTLFPSRVPTGISLSRRRPSFLGERYLPGLEYEMCTSYNVINNRASVAHSFKVSFKSFSAGVIRPASLSNVLEAIPDELCNLTELTDLNLVRNKLVALPDRCVRRTMVDRPRFDTRVDSRRLTPYHISISRPRSNPRSGLGLGFRDEYISTIFDEAGPSRKQHIF